jgi:hypothetical protein
VGFDQVSFWVSGFFSFYRVSGSFQGLLDFFWFRVPPQVKNKTHTRTQFCVGRLCVRPMGAKMNLNLHPSGLKPAGRPKPEPEPKPRSLPLTARKFDSIWVIIDRLTKSAHFIPINSKNRVGKYAEIYIARMWSSKDVHL